MSRYDRSINPNIYLKNLCMIPKHWTIPPLHPSFLVSTNFKKMQFHKFSSMLVKVQIPALWDLLFYEKRNDITSTFCNHSSVCPSTQKNRAVNYTMHHHLCSLWGQNTIPLWQFKHHLISHTHTHLYFHLCEDFHRRNIVLILIVLYYLLINSCRFFYSVCSKYTHTHSLSLI